MNGVITYNSKYGATRQYAAWLHQALQMPIVLPDILTKEQMEQIDFLVIGTPVYFGKLRMRKWLHHHAADISAKKIFLFIVNATPPNEETLRRKFVQDSVPDNIRRRCEIFFLPGRLIHQQLSWLDRMMVKFAESHMKDPDKKQAIHTDIDEVKIEHLTPLINAVGDYQAGRPRVYVY